MKKLIALLLAAVMVLGLCACAESGGSEKTDAAAGGNSGTNSDTNSDSYGNTNSYCNSNNNSDSNSNSSCCKV